MMFFTLIAKLYALLLYYLLFYLVNVKSIVINLESIDEQN